MRARTLTALRALDGAALLGRAARDGRAEATLSRASRVLGARQLVQAALTARSPTRGTLHLEAAVDATHGASMLLLAAGSRRWRAPAVQSAATALALTVCAVRVAARRSPERP